MWPVDTPGMNGRCQRTQHEQQRTGAAADIQHERARDRPHRVDQRRLDPLLRNRGADKWVVERIQPTISTRRDKVCRLQS
jgi:hypothetical protein